MEPSTATEQKQQVDVYAHITDKFIKKLEDGVMPWLEPWGAVPINLVTQQPYYGLNAVILGSEHYDDCLFLSFDQVNKLGGKVRRGAKGHTIIYWPKPTSESSSKPAEPKYYTVFNIKQCEKIPDEKIPAKNTPALRTGYPLLEKDMPQPPKIVYKAQQAYYDGVEDVVYIPKPKGKDGDGMYFAQLCHLLIHSTGHSCRLKREGVEKMSAIPVDLYLKEELVAQIGTCLLLSHFGISMGYKPSHGEAYHWAEKLKGDKHFIFDAASEAQQAVDYILEINRNESSASKS